MSKRHYIIPVFIPHLGCPHQCVFCNQKEITGFYGEVQADQVRAQIIKYLATMPPSDRHVEVAFYGGSFTGLAPQLQKTYLSVAREFLDRAEIQGIRISTRPDYIDSEVLHRLEDNGVSIVELGVQSMDTEVLAQTHRGHTPEQVAHATELLKVQGFQVGLQMMIGLPADSKEKAIRTAEQIIDMNPDFVRIYPVLVIEGTPLAKMYRSGLYNPWSLEHTVDVCKDLLASFRAADIPVIRMGLQPTDEINPQAQVLAGPFHPAFGELVESALAREKVARVCADLIRKSAGGALVITVSPRDESIVRGQKNCNIKWLKEHFCFREINIKTDGSLPRGEFQVQAQP